MPSTLEKLSPTRAKLTVEIPFAALKKHLDKAYQNIAEQVNIPGFRKGKVPAGVIDSRFGRGVVLQEAINAALPDAYGAAVNEHQLNPLGQPEVEVTKLEDGDLVEFTAEVDVRPDFELPDTSGISVEVDPIEVTDEQLEERVDLLRQRFATTTEVDRPAAEGDLVVLDLLGSQDGEPLADATAEGVTYKLGSGGMLEGLDDAVTGLSVGESKEFRSTLVGGTLKGTECDIKVTVQKVSEQELPEVDDEFAQMVSEFDTAEQMRADLRDGLTRMARLDQATNARDKVLEAIIAQTDIPLPEALAAAELDARKQQVNAQLAQAGLTIEQYLAESEEEVDDEDAFWADLDERTRAALKAQLVLDKFADDKEIGVDQQDLSQLIVRKAAQAGTSPEQEAQHMMEHNHLPEWMQEVRRTKALGALVEAAAVTDTTGAVVDLKGLNPDGTLREQGDEDETPTPEQANPEPADVEQTDAEELETVVEVADTDAAGEATEEAKA